MLKKLTLAILLFCVISIPAQQLKLSGNMKQDSATAGLVSNSVLMALKFKDSTLVISYRDDGIPSTDELIVMLEAIGKRVEVKKLDYK